MGKTVLTRFMEEIAWLVIVAGPIVIAARAIAPPETMRVLVIRGTILWWWIGAGLGAAVGALFNRRWLGFLVGAAFLPLAVAVFSLFFESG